MQKRLSAALALGFMAFAVPAMAQAPIPHVRGTITKVDGDVIMVKTRKGDVVSVTLDANAPIAGVFKSQIADIMNTGGSRWGGSTTAAMFLKEFVGETPWIHLDIAGVAWLEEQKPWIAKGPSGTPVRSLVEWIRSYAR